MKWWNLQCQVTIEVPESEARRVEAVISARLPQDWSYVSHRRVGGRSHSGELLEGNNCKWKFIAALICCAVPTVMLMQYICPNKTIILSWIDCAYFRM